MKNSARKELLRIRDEIPYETRMEKDALIKLETLYPARVPLRPDHFVLCLFQVRG